MKALMNEAQQRERIAHGIGSIAFALDVLVLIVLALFVGPVYAIVWIILSLIGAYGHFRTVKDLGDSRPTDSKIRVWTDS